MILIIIQALLTAVVPQMFRQTSHFAARTAAAAESQPVGCMLVDIAPRVDVGAAGAHVKVEFERNPVTHIAACLDQQPTCSATDSARKLVVVILALDKIFS